MKQLCKEAFEFAMKKATTEQQKDQIIKNAKSMKIFQNEEILLGGVKIILE